MECESCGWQPTEGINPPNVKEIGEFGVAEHNMVALADLKFERVVRCERQVEKDPLSELVFSSTNKENDKRKSSAVVSEANILDEMEWQ
nr:cysteine proteinase inhibitor 5 [Quercus suber]